MTVTTTCTGSVYRQVEEHARCVGRRSQFTPCERLDRFVGGLGHSPQQPRVATSPVVDEEPQAADSCPATEDARCPDDLGVRGDEPLVEAPPLRPGALDGKGPRRQPRDPGSGGCTYDL